MTSTTTQTATVTADNVLRLFPEVRTNPGTSSLGTSSVATGTDAVLEGYDEEQIRLMDEVCIVLDPDDVPIGTASKKVCQWLSFTSSNVRSPYSWSRRSSDEKYQ
jgi:isopentenyl-diphosphate delta-isomerase